MTDLVKYSNKMHNFPLVGMTEVDLNFFYTICSKVKDKGTDIVEIGFAELKDLSGYTAAHKSNEQFIADLENMNKRLLKCNGRIETESEIIYFNLFSTFRVSKNGDDKLTVRVNQDFTWLLNNIAREFTAFELKQYVSVRGVYTKALYRLLKQWRTQGQTPKYTVAELKEKLATPDYAPKILMRDVINPAIEELKQKKVWSNLYVEIVYKRGRGKPIDGYIFHFSKDITEGQMSIDNYPQYLPNADERQKSKSSKEKKPDLQREYDFDALEKDVVAN